QGGVADLDDLRLSLPLHTEDGHPGDGSHRESLLVEGPVAGIGVHDRGIAHGYKANELLSQFHHGMTAATDLDLHLPEQILGNPYSSEGPPLGAVACRNPVLGGPVAADGVLC